MTIPGLNAGWGCGGEILVRTLSCLGIRHIFSISGSQVLPVYDSIPRVKGGPRLVVPRSETHAAFMAEGFGQAAGFPAAVMSTLGPGVANECVGLYSASLSRSPLLSIAPYQPPYKYNRIEEVFQGLDHPAFLGPVCKKTFLVNDRRELPSTIREALDAALEKPQGPVHVDISFPLLFKRSFFRAGRRPSRVGDGREARQGPIVVTETGKGPTHHEMKTGDVLSPGVRGFGIPFSLGVVLALQDRPVFVLTGAGSLMRHLDSLAVGVTHGIPLKILSLDGTDSAEDIADFYRIPYERAEEIPGAGMDDKGLHIVLSSDADPG